jgi:hypothetical protein
VIPLILNDKKTLSSLCLFRPSFKGPEKLKRVESVFLCTGGLLPSVEMQFIFKLVNLFLKVFHSIEQMPDGINSCYVDGKIVVQMGVSFQFGQLGCGKATGIVFYFDIYKSVFPQHQDKVRFDVAVVAKIADDN